MLSAIKMYSCHDCPASCLLEFSPKRSGPPAYYVKIFESIDGSQTAGSYMLSGRNKFKDEKSALEKFEECRKAIEVCAQATRAEKIKK